MRCFRPTNPMSATSFVGGKQVVRERELTGIVLGDVLAEVRELAPPPPPPPPAGQGIDRLNTIERFLETTGMTQSPTGHGLDAAHGSIADRIGAPVEIADDPRFRARASGDRRRGAAGHSLWRDRGISRFPPHPGTRGNWSSAGSTGSAWRSWKAGCISMKAGLPATFGRRCLFFAGSAPARSSSDARGSHPDSGAGEVDVDPRDHSQHFTGVNP